MARALRSQTGWWLAGDLARCRDRETSRTRETGPAALAANIVRAERGFRVDPASFLYLPLRIMIAETEEGTGQISAGLLAPARLGAGAPPLAYQSCWLVPRLGCLLTPLLFAVGEWIADVQPKLAARVRLLCAGIPGRLAGGPARRYGHSTGIPLGSERLENGHSLSTPLLTGA
jgi:hypothetical protein